MKQHHVADDAEFFGVFGQTDVEARWPRAVKSQQGAAASAQVNIELGSDAFELPLQFWKSFCALGNGVVVYILGPCRRNL